MSAQPPILPPSPAFLSGASAVPPPARLRLDPGGLLRAGESVRFIATAGGGLVLRRGLRGGFAEIARARLAPAGMAAGRPAGGEAAGDRTAGGEVADGAAADGAAAGGGEAGGGTAGGWAWTPPECGMWLAEFTTDGGEVLRRPFAVVTREWAVCQITIGAFTSEDFADVIHPAGVAADYYVTGFPAATVAATAATAATAAAADAATAATAAAAAANATIAADAAPAPAPGATVTITAAAAADADADADASAATAAGAAVDFTCSDPRWAGYERLHGDAIHPHVMADAFGAIAPALAHDDPNWDSLPPAQIDARLAALQAWWLARGYAPLDRVASYTPSNRLVAACARAGIGVLHSLVPGQNWSDGDWSINHWGMPTCPFWIAADDFRKAGARDGIARDTTVRTTGPRAAAVRDATARAVARDGAARTPVLGMTMNHYHLLAPHLTHWGDFALSPSHFTRWLRAADSGGESRRFRQFLADTVRGGTPVGDAPFFFVAGFEFGRTFGTAGMTAWNRAGLRRLLALARDGGRLVFATSGDVRAYHQRHVPRLAQRVFRQRDSWVGVTTNGKPGQAGDSIVLELDDYQALIREDSPLPWLYYDYRERWDFATGDPAAPRDRAAACAAALRVDISPARDRAVITAAAPLPRAIPFALWDAAPAASPAPAGPPAENKPTENKPATNALAENVPAENAPAPPAADATRAFRVFPLAPLDDARAVTLLEAPAGWSGRAVLALRPFAPRPGRIEQGRWRLQAFGQDDVARTTTGKTDIGETDAAATNTGETGAAETNTGGPDTAGTNAARTDTGGINAGETDTDEMNAGEINATKTDAAETDAAKPDTTGPDAGGRHVYLHLDAPLVADAPVQITLRKPARVEGPGAAGDPGPRAAGPLTLVFGPLKTWYRFHGCEPADITPPGGRRNRPRARPAPAARRKRLPEANRAPPRPPRRSRREPSRPGRQKHPPRDLLRRGAPARHAQPRSAARPRRRAPRRRNHRRAGVWRRRHLARPRQGLLVSPARPVRACRRARRRALRRRRRGGALDGVAAQLRPARARRRVSGEGGPVETRRRPLARPRVAGRCARVFCV
jgi:hypothetical protein